MQIVFHSVDRETLQNLKKSITIPKVVGQVAVKLYAKHRRMIQSFKRIMLEPRLHESREPWTHWSEGDACVLSGDVQSQCCSALMYQFPGRDLHLFTGYCLMSFTCMASVSVTDELILEISCPDLQGSPAQTCFLLLFLNGRKIILIFSKLFRLLWMLNWPYCMFHCTEMND